MTASDSERVLLAKLRSREQSAFEQIYDLYCRRAFGLAVQLLGDHTAAEDVVQEAFLAIWRDAERIDPERGRCLALILAVVHHKASDYLRRQRVRQNLASQSLGEVAAGPQSDPLNLTLQKLDQAALREAMSALPQEQMLTLRLVYFGGLSRTEVARMTHAPVGTVKSRLRIALQRLRLMLRDRVRV